MQHINRYIPPDIEGTTSANRLQRRRAPGTLRKDGTQTVRFEMPFAVWCHTCNPHAIIGQGVRFNAEKRKVGNYYSTPIWAFTLKHAACGGALEIRTDPQNTRYVVVAGGKARDYGDEVREGEGGVPILTAEERERRREDAFAALEGKVEEKAAGKENARRIEELYRAREKDWDDPWARNRRMRDEFRRERKVRKQEEEATERLKERLGTSMEILPEAEEDARRARLVDFRGDGQKREDAEAARSTPSRERRGRAANGGRESKAEALKRQLLGNTREGMNPFGKAA